MAALPKVFIHEEPRRTLGPVLEALLPYSLPVLRRIQYHLQTPHSIVFSTLSSDHSAELDGKPHAIKTDNALNGVALEGSQRLPHLSHPFAVFYVDRSRYPETESWIFSTADLPASPFTEKENYAHILSILNTASLHPRLRSGLALASEKHVDPTAMKCGAIHIASLRLMIGAADWDARHQHVELGWATSSQSDCWAKGNRTGGGMMRGYTVVVLKYVYAPLARTQNGNIDGNGTKHSGDVSVTTTPSLPKGLFWATELDAEDYDTVVTNSAIRRRRDTLAMTPSCAVRDAKGKLVAWTFCSPDGSFATLNVLPEFRGRGIARALIKGLMASMATATVTVSNGEHAKDGSRSVLAFNGVTPEAAWTHSDTVEENTAAQAVLGKSGGRVMWRCYWTFLDLSEIQRLAREFTNAQ